MPNFHRLPEPPLAQEVGQSRLAIEVDDSSDLGITHQQARLIAFGSQLVFGSVGLNAAGRIYDASEIPMMQVPTILLSVLPHYPSVHHLGVPASWIELTLGDLTRIGALDNIELVTLGYLASPEQAEAIARWYDSLPIAMRPPLVLDPTLGDAELGFYTDPSVADAIRDTLVHLAKGLTPNLFELAQLSGEPLSALSSVDRIEEVARSVMGPNTDWVVVTGIDLPPDDDNGHGGQVGEALVTVNRMRLFRREAVPTSAKGLGDLFTAALNMSLLDGDRIDDAVDAAATEVLAHIRPSSWRHS